MTRAKQLARELGVQTADEVPPAKSPSEHDRVRGRWDWAQKEIFRQLAPSATYISGADCLLSVTVVNKDGSTNRFGHNRPQRPIRVGYTGQWPDRVTPTENRVPYWWQGMLMRIWTPAEVFAKQLAFMTTEALMPIAEPSELLNRFFAISEDVDLIQLEQEIHIAAWSKGIPTWDDVGMASEIRQARTACNVNLDDPDSVQRAVDWIMRRAHRALERRVSP